MTRRFSRGSRETWKCSIGCSGSTGKSCGDLRPHRPGITQKQSPRPDPRQSQSQNCPEHAQAPRWAQHVPMARAKRSGIIAPRAWGTVTVGLRGAAPPGPGAERLGRLGGTAATKIDDSWRRAEAAANRDLTRCAAAARFGTPNSGVNKALYKTRAWCAHVTA